MNFGPPGVDQSQNASMVALRCTIKQTTLCARSRIARALAAFDARLPRCGRVELQTRRCLIALGGTASMKDLRAWCYAGKPFRRWQCFSIRRALWKLGAVQIGRAGGTGRPAIYRLAPTP